MTRRAIPSAPQVPPCGAEVQCQHASEEEYKAFLTRAGLSAPHCGDLNQRRRRFIERWPDLRGWLREPLTERIGRPHGTHRRDLRDRTSYDARSYLVYLCFTDRLRIDYDFLLAIGQLHTTNISKFLCGDLGVGQLSDEAQRLGFCRFSSNLTMGWALPRIALHTGIRNPSLLRLEHLNELALAMYEFHERKDLAFFWPGTTDRKQPVEDRPSHYVWFGHISRLRNVLYHRGQIAGPPRAGRRRKGRPLAAQPEMRTVVDRWVDLYDRLCAPRRSIIGNWLYVAFSNTWPRPSRRCKTSHR